MRTTLTGKVLMKRKENSDPDEVSPVGDDEADE